VETSWLAEALRRLEAACAETISCCNHQKIIVLYH
jgi:hypothetical protein